MVLNGKVTSIAIPLLHISATCKDTQKGPKRKVNMPFPYQNQYLTSLLLVRRAILQKKKTYPSLFELYCQGYLPKQDFTDRWVRKKCVHR